MAEAYKFFVQGLTAIEKLKKKKLKNFLLKKKKLTFKLLLTLIEEYKKLNYYFKCS